MAIVGERRATAKLGLVRSRQTLPERRSADLSRARGLLRHGGRRLRDGPGV